MPFVSREQVLERFRTDGTNSSHFVWLLAELRYYECANGWLFAFTTQAGVTLVALEPLVAGAPREYGPALAQAFEAAWNEFREATQARLTAFVSVYAPFASVLRAAGFSCIRVGQEPWVELSDCIPTGNAGKGVRNARNQALAAGLEVEEWAPAELEQEPGKRAVLTEIHAEWRAQRLVELGGFMNTVEPFLYPNERRYFVLRSKARVEAYLVATPVPGRNGYFLEDLVTRGHAPRGSGELLTLEAMVRLRESGAREASLGVVSMTTLDPGSAGALPPLIRFVLVKGPALFSKFYNFQGMEVYRKRFKPRVWEEVFVGVRNDAPGISATVAWLRVMWAMLLAFRPRPRLTHEWLWRKVTSPLHRTPLTTLFTLVTVGLFWRINHFGNLPDWALARFGFFARAAWDQWLYRTVMSDLLYFDIKHFLSAALPLFALIYWGERTHKRAFFATVFLGSILLDDFLNYFILVKPFEHFHPAMFHHLVSYKDVGGSLLMATLVGMQLCQFRLIREPLVALITLAFVLGFAFTSVRLEWLILNLNHAIFFVIGFLVGKAEFEWKRHVSRKASRGKPPVAKSVRIRPLPGVE